MPALRTLRREVLCPFLESTQGPEKKETYIKTHLSSALAHPLGISSNHLSSYAADTVL